MVLVDTTFRGPSDDVPETSHVGWVGAHWIVLYVNDNNVIYFDSFGVEHIPKGIHRK